MNPFDENSLAGREAEEGMILSVISPPENQAGEHQQIINLFEAGLNRYHVRKPGMGFSEYFKYLVEIPSEFHNQLILHNHYFLAEEMGLMGVHIKEEGQNKGQGLLGGSIHKLSEMHLKLSYDYLFLSPILNSISKKGYYSTFDIEVLSRELSVLSSVPDFPSLFALGGVSPENAGQIKELGFKGAVLLGTIWEYSEEIGLDNFKRIYSDLCPQFAY